MDIKKGDKVVALKHVIERAKSMDIDISGEGTVEQLKDTGMSTEQALVSFPNYRCWIYTNEISKEKESISDEYEKLVEDIEDRLHNAGFTGVHAIMSHVEASFKHFGIDWKLKSRHAYRRELEFLKAEKERQKSE